MKTYLLVFNGNQTNRKNVIARIDALSAMVNWMAFFDNALCVVSEANASELTDIIRAAVPDVQFIITTLEPGKRNGWLPKSVWDFVKNPTIGVEAAE